MHVYYPRCCTTPIYNRDPRIPFPVLRYAIHRRYTLPRHCTRHTQLYTVRRYIYTPCRDLRYTMYNRDPMQYRDNTTSMSTATLSRSLFRYTIPCVYAHIALVFSMYCQRSGGISFILFIPRGVRNCCLGANISPHIA